MADGFDKTVEGRIASAWAALQGARAAVAHSLNCDNLAAEDKCEAAVNDLLDKLWASYTVEQRAQIDGRPTKGLVDA